MKYNTKSFVLMIVCLMTIQIIDAIEISQISIDKTPLSGMPWDSLVVHPDETVKGKKLSEILVIDHVLAMQAAQSGLSEHEMIKQANNVIANYSVTDSPRHKIVMRNGHYSFTLWNGGGIVGFIHVINGNEFVLTVFKDHAPVNYYYKE
jgi:hypothetical protein